MEGKNKDRGGLSFGYPVTALAAIGLMAAVLVALSWVNGRRAEAELIQLKAKLCASNELASPLSVNDDSGPSSWQAWAIVDALAEPQGDRSLDIRVLQQDTGGWKQWHRWSQEPEWIHDSELERIAQRGICEGSVKNGTVRVVRPLRTSPGKPTLIVVERKRQ